MARARDLVDKFSMLSAYRGRGKRSHASQPGLIRNQASWTLLALIGSRVGDVKCGAMLAKTVVANGVIWANMAIVAGQVGDTASGTFQAVQSVIGVLRR